MKEGLFTGRGLADAFTDEMTDWTGARRIVNGRDRAVEIAAYARAFRDALNAAAGPVLAPPSPPVAPALHPQENVMKSIKGYRTLAFNAIVATIGVAQSLDWVSLVGAQYAGVARAVVSLANMALRAATDGPVGASHPRP